MKISFQHIAKTAITLSVFLLAATLSEGNQHNFYFSGDDETTELPDIYIQNDLADSVAFDLEKDTDEKEKIATPFFFTSIQKEFFMFWKWPAMCSSKLSHQIKISVFRLDLPPPDYC